MSSHSLRIRSPINSTTSAFSGLLFNSFATSNTAVLPFLSGLNKTLKTASGLSDFLILAIAETFAFLYFDAKSAKLSSSSFSFKAISSGAPLRFNILARASSKDFTNLLKVSG